MRNLTFKLLASFFYLGYLPFMPGTFASLVGLGIFYLVKEKPVTYLAVTSCLVFTGFLISGRAEEIFRKKDHRAIVIDEVCGMLLSLLFIPCQLKFVIIAFFIFRLMDTIKPYPADRLQDLKGSLGVMSDDIIAGIYTNIILQIALRFTSFTIS